ncbi:MAG: DUF5682 family protein [Saprospiraceae bacterium]
MAVHILGIRHHGPGSARHVLAALQHLQPDIILIEGPPEGESMLNWAIHPDMQPPVALLAYVPDNPQQAVFYPFAEFSPEWQAIKFGMHKHIPVRFIDMPLVHKLAMTDSEAQSVSVEAIAIEESKVQRNPMAYLAEIAGYEDAEVWWEQQFEIAQHPIEVFDAVREAMMALRENTTPTPEKNEAIREAFMRRAIRLAEREMFHTIVVVCGAWHVPALEMMPSQKEDDLLLKNLPKTKVETTWIPWTNDRLSFESGYGAGIHSPGWYQHHWTNPEDDGTLWLTHTARVFRQHKIDISSAHIIESVRLASSLAGLRSFNRPGLAEYNEATQTVMCMGDEVLMKLVWQDLIVGDKMGEIPEGTPQVPLQYDLEKWLKKYRLKLSNIEKPLSLDLREPNDLQKSILLHRLLVLDLDFGKIQHITGKGTFKEAWTLRWYPELTIKLLEKAPWGNTIELAANQYLIHNANQCRQLDEITHWVARSLPADLRSGIEQVMQRMDALAAGTSDTSILMNAFVPLVQVQRYGNVRKTDLATITTILHAIFYRIIAGLPMSCTGIDEEQAQVVAESIQKTHQAILLSDDEIFKNDWLQTLDTITTIQQVAPLIHGFCCKILYDLQYVDATQPANEFSKALSPNNEAAWSAAWLEGFLKDAATVLILDEGIWRIVNEWVVTLESAIFMQVVPLLRRTFATYNTVEKRKIAEKVAHGGTHSSKRMRSQDFDVENARQILPVLEHLLGL